MPGCCLVDGRTEVTHLGLLTLLHRSYCLPRCCRVNGRTEVVHLGLLALLRRLRGLPALLCCLGLSARFSAAQPLTVIPMTLTLTLAPTLGMTRAKTVTRSKRWQRPVRSLVAASLERQPDSV